MEIYKNLNSTDEDPPGEWAKEKKEKQRWAGMWT